MYIHILYNQRNNYNVRLCVDMACSVVNKRRNSFYQSSLSCKLKKNIFVNIGFTYFIIKIEKKNYIFSYIIFSYICYSTLQCIHLDSQLNRPHQRENILYCSNNTHCRVVRIHYHSIQVCILC